MYLVYMLFQILTEVAAHLFGSVKGVPLGDLDGQGQDGYHRQGGRRVQLYKLSFVFFPSSLHISTPHPPLQSAETQGGEKSTGRITQLKPLRSTVSIGCAHVDDLKELPFRARFMGKVPLANMAGLENGWVGK